MWLWLSRPKMEQYFFAAFTMELTWSWVLRRSMGAVRVRETASDSPAERTNLFHSPKPVASSGNSMGIARLSPTSKTSEWTKWVTTLITVSLRNTEGGQCLIVIIHICFTKVLHHHSKDLTRLCFHEDTSSPMLSTGLRMTCCRNSPQSTVMELSLSILGSDQQRQPCDIFFHSRLWWMCVFSCLLQSQQSKLKNNL